MTTPIDRRDFLKITAAAGATALAACTQTAQERPMAKKRPHIIFVFSDEHRWASLPFTETPQLVAPHLTRFAEEGTRMENCVASSPVCVPYRGMLMTGQWPHQSSCISNDYFGNSNIIGKDAPTIAHTFKQGGYVTGYVGKWHLDEETVYNAGFDYHKNWLYGDDHMNSKWRDVPSREPYRTHQGYNAIAMTDQALEFIGQHAHGPDPMFLMLSLNPPHWRWDDAPPEFVALYPEEQIVFRPNVKRERYKTGDELFWYRNYLAHITAVDREVGRLLDALKEHGIDDDTVIVYTSDHGSSFGSNNVGSKGNPFDESVRVPLFFRWPGNIPAKRVLDHNVGTVDLYATLCGFAGITPPSFCDGLDFSPVMLGKPGPDPESQFILINNFQRNYFRSQLDPDAENIFYPFRGVRTKRYTYAVRATGGWILYDNQNDPYQLRNLVNEPSVQPVKEKLARELQRWLAKAEDPYIPEAWRELPLAERIALQNRYYTLLPYKEQWEKYKTAAVAPHAKDATEDQAKALRAAAERVFDEPWFGYYKAFHLEVNGKKRNSKRPLEEIRAELVAHEKKAAEAFAEEAKRIMQRTA